MLKVILLLVITIPLFCQYSSDDKELVQTTYLRTFNKAIFREYLLSDEPEKIKAALLSISHSTDTSFVNEILRTSFVKYGEYISFALGQIGPCEKSTQFLLSSLNLYKNQSRNIYNAIGKTGSKEALNKIILEYSSSGNFYNGISLALVNFNSRGITADLGKTISLLKQEINHQTGQRLLDALYALYRIGPDSTITGDLLKFLDYTAKNEDDIFKVQYILGSFRKLKYFPGIPVLLDKLLSHSDWRIRTEAVKCAVYYKFTKEEELKLYINLLKDNNPNVARQAAISLSSIMLKYPLNDKLKEAFEDALMQPGNYSRNTFGELFLSYIRLYKPNIPEFISRYETKVDIKFICEAIKENTEYPEESYKYLRPNISSAEGHEKIYIMDALLSLQKSMIDNTEFAEDILKGLNSDFPPVISVTAESLDSLFIRKYNRQIREELNSFTKKQLNNPAFSDALVSASRLAKQLNDLFYSEVLNSFKYSKTSSVKNYALTELKQSSGIESYFDKIWDMAFEFTTAIVKTNKGEFKIKFSPEYSPLSTGNFCSLASQKYFDGVVFHRVVPDFVIQTGDKTGTGWGGPGYEIVSEFSPLPFDKGYVGMASSGKDTEGSQWFVMHSSYPHLNAKYSNFGKIISGMNVVNIIDEGDKVLTVELE